MLKGKFEFRARLELYLFSKRTDSDGYKHGGWIPTETSVTEFSYKSVTLSLEELKNIKIILFLIHELF